MCSSLLSSLFRKHDASEWSRAAFEVLQKLIYIMGQTPEIIKAFVLKLPCLLASHDAVPELKRRREQHTWLQILEITTYIDQSIWDLSKSVLVGWEI